MRVIGIFVILVPIVATAACTTMRPVTLQAGANAPSYVVVGDRVRATTKNGEVLSFDVTGVKVDTFEGTSRSGETLAVALDDLASLEVRGPAPGRTGALVGSLLFGLLSLKWLEDNVAFFPGP